MEVIMEASREIDYGRITVSFAGNPSNVVDIVAEKHFRFRHEKDAKPVSPKPQDRRGSGRYGKG
jgi:hypothetical protein